VLLSLCVLLFLSAVIVGFRRRGGTSRLRYLPALIGGLNLLFILGLVVMLQALAFDAIFAAVGAWVADSPRVDGGADDHRAGKHRLGLADDLFNNTQEGY